MTFHHFNIALILTKTVNKVFCRADFVAWNPEKKNEAFYEKISRQFLMFNQLLSFLGFLPKNTAQHHREHALEVLQKALDEAKISPKDIDVVCYTKGMIWYRDANNIVQ